MSATPTLITILGNNYPLKAICAQHYSTKHLQIMVEGKPVTGIDVAYGEFNPDSLKRAEACIKSFLSNNCLYNAMYGDDSKVCEETLSEEVLSRKDLTIELYDYLGAKSIVLESTDASQETYVKFSIWDRELAQKVYSQLREGKRDSRGRPYPSFVEYYDFCEF